MVRACRVFLALVLAAGAGVPLHGQQSVAANSIGGTWDLTWQTRRGPSRKGYLVVQQEGNRIKAEIHGQGQVKATGSVAGSTFALRGTRFAVPYTIGGSFVGDRMTGALKVLTVNREFTGIRRASGR